MLTICIINTMLQVMYQQYMSTLALTINLMHLGRSYVTNQGVIVERRTGYWVFVIKEAVVTGFTFPKPTVTKVNTYTFFQNINYSNTIMPSYVGR